jgi:hypothetical protein
VRAHLLVGFAAVLVLGCGSNSFAPVSGRITLDNKPLAGATVLFVPMAEKGSIQAGIGSVGTTDENGAYTLKTTKGQTGAQTGKHRVSITKRKPGPEQNPDDDHRTLRGLPKDEGPPSTTKRAS